MADPTKELIQAVAVTSELCGRTFSDPAARMFVSDLAAYPVQQVLGALTRCRKEVRGMLTVQDVVSRLDDGRPGPEEAWSLMPLNEDQTVVWTEEMCLAAAASHPLVVRGDMVAGRMAFKEAYTRLVQQARDAGKTVQWSASLGHDPRQRQSALQAAVQAGRLTLSHAQEHCPALTHRGPTLTLENLIQKQKAIAA